MELGADRRALRASNGRFLSPRRGGEVFAEGLSIGERETLTVVPRGGGRISLQTVDGRYLTRGRGDVPRLLADASSTGERETFDLSIAPDTEP